MRWSLIVGLPLLSIPECSTSWAALFSVGASGLIPISDKDSQRDSSEVILEIFEDSNFPILEIGELGTQCRELCFSNWLNSTFGCGQ